MQALYLSIRAHLEKMAPLWQHSVLDSWDQVRACIPEEWLIWSRSVPHTHWHRLGLDPGHSSAPPSLRQFVETAQGFNEQLPVHSKRVAIPPRWSDNLTPKKKHEIEKILGALEAAPPDHVIDIGGGMGHLARHLARAFSCPVDSIDISKALQDRGALLNRSEPWRPSCEGKVTFHTHKFSGNLPAEVRLHEGSLLLGLHTCGPLAWRHLELMAVTRTRALNFGCCYELLDPMVDINRSGFCRAHPITHGEESLLLATRGGIQEHPGDFEFQQRVLDYRYSLEAFLREIARADLSRRVGTAPLALYRGEYELYARDRLRRLGLEDSLYKDNELGSTRQKESQKVLDQRFASFARNLLARPLEMSLLLDRALWIEEQTGLKTTLNRVFDPAISPRNIAIHVQSEAHS